MRTASAIRPNQPTGTLDEFLADPVVADELQVVIERLMSDKPLALNGYVSVSGMRVKVKERWESKRTRYPAEDVARILLAAWREHRP